QIQVKHALEGDLENNAESRRLISCLLARSGHKIVNAEGQDHALLLSEVAHIDLALTNRAVCKDRCHSFCQRIRLRRPNLPVVMYSLDRSAEEAEEALRSGVSKFLSTPEELLGIAKIASELIPEIRTA